MEMHEDAVEKGDRVILVDDLIATGGTAEGAVKLLRQLGAQVLAACFIIDLPDLGGADKLRKLDVPVRTLITSRGSLKADCARRSAGFTRRLFPCAVPTGRGRYPQTRAAEFDWRLRGQERLGPALRLRGRAPRSARSGLLATFLLVGRVGCGWLRQRERPRIVAAGELTSAATRASIGG